MARPNGFEPLTPRFVVCCSISNQIVVIGREARRPGETLPRRLPREPVQVACRAAFPDKQLILLVGAQGLEPWTR